jgi:transcriptional regulator with XRE-family HTH domain
MTRNQFKARFKKWLPERRKSKGVTQAVLAAQTGLTQDWISHFENGRRLPDAYAFHRLQMMLGWFY